MTLQFQTKWDRHRKGNAMFRKSLILSLIAAAVLTVTAPNASAYYNASLGRWVTRDPGPSPARAMRVGAPTVPGMTPSPYATSPAMAQSPRIGQAGYNSQYADGMSLYEYVRSNPVRYTDPKGTNIYLKTGNNTGRPGNDLVHQSVCVDIWGWDGCKTKTLCFYYGHNGKWRFVAPFRMTWLGWKLTWAEMTGGDLMMVGEIDVMDDVGEVTKTKKTTIEQDKNWYKVMYRKRLHKEDLYTVAWFNCRKYARKEFADAPGEEE